MRSKLQWASVTAVAATMMIALFSAVGSGASAQEFRPAVIQIDPVIHFTSQPVIQPLPEAVEDTPSDTDQSAGESAEVDEAATLAELVAAQSSSGNLSSEMHCLASAIYFEARGESLDGQLSVGRVIIERAQSGGFPDSYCGVVYQRSQFSFVRGNSMPRIRKGSAAWRNAVAIARIAHEGTWESKTEGALFFHATRVSPGWRLTRLARVDNHIFYR